MEARFDLPRRWHADRDTAEERADLEAGVRGELRFTQVDGDPTEPREHRAAAERLRPALDRDAVLDGDEPDLVALGIPCDGNALFITAADANVPAQKPSLKRRSARRSRMPAGYPAATSMAAMDAETIRGLLDQAFPDAPQLDVEDRTGSGDHFQVTVVSAEFDGVPLLDQHRRVNAALAAPLGDGSIHELRIKTKGTA